MAHRLAPLFILLPILALGCDTPGFKTGKKATYPPSLSQLAQQPIGTTTMTSAGLNGSGDKPAQVPAVFSQSLSISDLIAQACGIAPRNSTNTNNKGGVGVQQPQQQQPQQQTGSSASFDFDSAAIADSDRQMLAEVAKCLTEGALKGKAVTLVGRADARGEPEYNMTLGESRANTVNRYLVDLGVGKDRMKVTSRGEMDASGTNEEGWAKDRRVDIELSL
jgi:peptidoglycan-associated lipoprotein